MKNAEKLLTAMEKAFTGHKIEIMRNFNAKIYCVFVDNNYVGNFEESFIEKGVREWREESLANS